jgi:hypothetical protein
VGIVCRRFIVDHEGRLLRLKNTTFERLLSDPLHHTMPALAGQRVRMAEILVELANRVPVRVVRRVYFVVNFDAAGRVDTERFKKQRWALADSALALGLAAPGHDDNSIVDAASRFIAQGAKWRPQAALAQQLDDSALGNS